MEAYNEEVFLDEEEAASDAYDQQGYIIFEDDATVLSPSATRMVGDEAEDMDGDVEGIVEYVEEIPAQHRSHTLTMRHINKGNMLGSTETSATYHCLECESDFETVDDFMDAHDFTGAYDNEDENMEKQWEVIEEDHAEVEHVIASDDVSIKEEVDVIEEHIEETTEEIVYSFADGLHTEEIDEAIIKNEQEEALNGEENENKYYCYECQIVFNDLESAENHKCGEDNAEAAHYIEMVEEIDEASEVVETEPYGAKHNSIYDCAHCDRSFGSIKALSSHSRTHKIRTDDMLQKEPATCNICNTTFSSVKNLKLHVKIHNKRQIKSIEDVLPEGIKAQYSEMNKFFCEICKKSFDQNLLAVHKNMHLNMEEYSCSICNKRFENLPSYEVHMQMHIEKKSAEIPVVPVKQSAVHDSKRKFPCQYCGREFQRPFEKVKHERVHTGEKPYACEICGKNFRVSYSLTLHLRTHTDIRPYVCATCNKRFKSQPVYAHHLRTHLAERSYKCDICAKTFTTSVQLCSHKNTHSKPYNCPECNRPFAMLYAVKLHMKTHNKASKSNENLKHPCGICGAKYARMFALRYHMKEQHSLELDASQALDLQNVIDMTAADEGENEQEVDEDSAVLIAAANDADCAAYIEAAVVDDDLDETHAATQHIVRTFDSSNDGQLMLQNEEIIVDNYHTEEVITDWLTK